MRRQGNVAEKKKIYIYIYNKKFSHSYSLLQFVLSFQVVNTTRKGIHVQFPTRKVILKEA